MAEEDGRAGIRPLQAALKRLVAACEAELNALSDQETALLIISKVK